MEPTGLYPSARDVTGTSVQYEEYASFRDYLLTVAEFDDGHACIDGEVVATADADRRMRFLSPYNFIIAGKSSPINSSDFDQRSGPILEALLIGTGTVEQLRDEASELPVKVMGSDPW